ncbi:MAG TPA: FtsX-like permease family protein [Candidatus Deferrimicrobiaceae bacterium]|nr:FtsX-like permease family protein [Candidatus Deferrimicrobiaceae bacterium]
MSRFVLMLAWRETRGAWRHFGYFFACITLGVSALVGVGSFADSLERTVARSAKSLMGGDIEIRSTQPVSEDAAALVPELRGGLGVTVTRVRELVAMAQSGGSQSQLVELKAVGAGYPFYGALVTEPGNVPLETLIGGGRALVHDSFLARLGLRVGDHFRVGDLELTIAGVIVKEPDRAVGVFSLGPRVLIAAEDLDRTGLVRPGSRVRHRTLFRLPEDRDAQALRDRLAEALPAVQRVSTYAQAQPGLRRFWDQLTMYLGLTGLVALMVGGIGVAVSVNAFVRQKLPSIAILKALGAGWRPLLAAYLLQTALLGLGGSALGALLGSAVQPLLAPTLTRLLPIELTLSFSPRAVLGGLAMGVGVTLLYALWPLLQIRHVPPALILRMEIEPRLRGRRPWAAAVPIAAGLAALALWQAGSWKIGALFAGGLAAALLLLALGARLVIVLARRVRWRAPAWRQGAANLHRPGSHAGPVLVSLGLAVMLIVSIALLDRSLRAQLVDRAPGSAPAFFFIDIQTDQAEPFARLVGAQGATAPAEMTPVVRSRLAAVNGAAITSGERSRREDAWYLTREYVLTWAAEPPGHNTVVGGRWWTPEEAAREPLISVEEEIARQLGVGLGDTLTFDIQGVPVSARVTSLRHVDWRSLTSNFFVIFSPGALDGAPSTYIATVRARPDEENRLQSAVVAAFPNITAIPIREVLERVSAILDQIALAVRLVAAFSIGAGLIVMAGALAITRQQRLYQSVILKALGATRGFVSRVFAVEYALLGAAAGAAGSALAALLAWAVLRFALDVPWRWAPGTLLAGVATATALALLVGFLGTRRLLGRRPLGVLRSE